MMSALQNINKAVELEKLAPLIAPALKPLHVLPASPGTSCLRHRRRWPSSRHSKRGDTLARKMRSRDLRPAFAS